tara:strand:- start:2786 stop:3253 length:468 start_codon:yes stop_codon:yes gene_type:complete
MEVVEDGYSYEDAGEELAEALQRCNDQRHDGHGYVHSGAEIEEAYRMAILQLQTIDFDAERAEHEHNIAMHKKWGGPMPAAVIMPPADDPKKLEIIIPDKHGNPVAYDVKPHTLQDVIPLPTDKGATPDKSGIGWRTKRRLKPETKLRRLTKPKD